MKDNKTPYLISSVDNLYLTLRKNMNYKQTLITKVVLGIGIFCSFQTNAGSMGDVATTQHVGGFVVGGNLGYGYLSSHEANNINDITTGAALSSKKPSLAKNYRNGHFIWGAHGGYDFALNNMFLVGVESGYKSLGQSSGWSKSYTYQSASNIPSQSTNYTTTITSYSYINKQLAVDFLITGHVYVYDRFPGLNLIGKAGAAYVRAHDSINFTSSFNTPISTNISSPYALSDYQSPVIWRIEPEVNLGVGYSFPHGVDVNVLYTYIGGTDGNTSTNGSATNYNTPLQAVFAFNSLSAEINYRFG